MEAHTHTLIQAGGGARQIRTSAFPMTTLALAVEHNHHYAEREDTYHTKGELMNSTEQQVQQHTCCSGEEDRPLTWK